MAERYRHLERSVNPRSTNDEVTESVTIARWIGLAFDDMHGLRETLLAEKEYNQSQRELAERLASGEISPGGTDYMESDSEGNDSA